MKTYYLVDGDNNIGTGLKGIDLLTPEDTVLIFHQQGLALTKLKKACEGSAADIQYIESAKSGRNSIDFQIITELGVLVGRREADFAYVISQDRGYEASISALQARFSDSFQEVDLRPSIEDCLHLSFLLTAKTREEVCAALEKECGSAHGKLIFSHLEALFTAPQEVAAPEEGEKKESAAPRARSVRRRNYRRKKPAEKKEPEGTPDSGK
jgi:hypothetical protein